MAVPRSLQGKTHHRVTHLGTIAFSPHDILKNPKLVSLATRIKLSPAEQAAYTQSIIEASASDNSKIAVSYAIRIVGEKIATAAREQWKPPNFAPPHWKYFDRQ